MITTMRGCVAHNDLWPWPISSRSFGLDLENRVRSVAFTVLDGFFLYLAQMITIIRGCVACYVFFRIWKFDGFFPYLIQMITSMRECVAYNDLWPWPISSRSFGLGLENRVRSVASTVLDGFFPYLIQMITSMRRCVACDDLWPWPISSRSFDLDFENCVRSVASTVLDGFFPYLVQMITSMRRCVACDDLWPWLISSRSFDLDFENRVRSVTFSVLDRLFPYLVCIGIFGSFFYKVFSWMQWRLTDDKSTLVQVMAWCHQAISHYLNQCWPRSISPYGITRPQWVKWYWWSWKPHSVTLSSNHGSAQDCSNSSALIMELLQTCNKPSIYWLIWLLAELCWHKLGLT